MITHPWYEMFIPQVFLKICILNWLLKLTHLDEDEKRKFEKSAKYTKNLLENI